jgi:peptide/nickel transport system substrate-binding protein
MTKSPRRDAKHAAASPHAFGRRSFLAAACALAGAWCAPNAAEARGRSPIGGRIALHLPWPTTSIDPHRIDDVAAALFGDALFDTLYARDETGAFAPLLAESDPEPEGNTLRVKIRRGVRFASGRGFDARSAAAALARARGAGAAGWLTDVPAPRVDTRGNALIFTARDPQALARALASSLVAMVAPRFQPERPDGTGPFRAERRGDALVLVRNPNAARGPAFLDEIVVRPAPDLSASLRAFESGADDIGWLGSGLFEPRPGARPFDAGAVGWAVLRTGRDAGAWDTPGTAQALADAMPHARLSHLVLGPPWVATGQPAWGGAPCELLVRDDAPWLLELGKVVAAMLSAPSHEVSVRPIAPAELSTRRAQRSFALALDTVRPFQAGGFGALVGLAAADDPAVAATLVRHPPRGDLSPRVITRTMRLGVLGEVRVQGGRVPDLVLPSSSAVPGIDFGAAVRQRR